MIPADAIRRASDNDLLLTAQQLGAVLRKATAVERVGPCLVCGGRDRFSVNVKKQTWNCRGCAMGGGVIDLVMRFRICTFPEAVAWLNGEASPADARIPAPAPVAKPNPEDEKSAGVIKRLVAGIIGELAPLSGTPGELYLAEVRKIDTAAIADVLERADAIGWHPSVLFREERHALDGRHLGAIIGVMTDPMTATPTGAISRTYLYEGRKVGPAKTLGQPAGIVRLSEDADVLGGLHLAEGLETALDAMARGFRPMWSTGSTAIMAKFPLLAGVEALTVFADHDQNGAGLRAADEAAERWLDAGRETHVYEREIKGDFNDAYREGVHGGL